MTVQACPRCGDQTLWRQYQGRAWCTLCKHEWIVAFVCIDPEAEWIAEIEMADEKERKLYAAELESARNDPEEEAADDRDS